MEHHQFWRATVVANEREIRERLSNVDEDLPSLRHTFHVLAQAIREAEAERKAGLLKEELEREKTETKVVHRSGKPKARIVQGWVRGSGLKPLPQPPKRSRKRNKRSRRTQVLSGFEI